jgi:hypothetical protein
MFRCGWNIATESSQFYAFFDHYASNHHPYLADYNISLGPGIGAGNDG